MWNNSREATRPLVGRIYDHVNSTLWAFLVAFAVWFSAVFVPQIPEIHARAAAFHANEIAAEQDLYCGKLGMGSKAAMYHDCTRYLGEYRAKIEQRIADETF